METDRWQLIDTLFAAVLELPAAERERFLDRECGGDDELRAAVLELVVADGLAEDFLEEPAVRLGTLDRADLSTLFRQAAHAAEPGSQPAIDPPQASATAPACPAAGEIIAGTYEVERQLGEGGMGTVYQARHVHLGKAFALKLINPGLASCRSTRQRFEREARALGRLEHPNIVGVTDYGIDEERQTPYLVMELLRGRSLHQHLQEQGPMPVDRALPLLEAIAGGLDHAHRQGILHRDLKPHNVIVADDPDDAPAARIVDLGVARFTATQAPTNNDEEAPQPTAAMVDATMPGSMVGTPAFLAPEVAAGRPATAASDLYSFGVLAFEMLVGRRPFLGTGLKLLKAHRREEPPLPSRLHQQLPPELDKPILALLAKNPDDRPASANEAVAALRRAWQRQQMRIWRSRELPKRLLIATVLALLALPTVPWIGSWEPIQDLENRTVDSRFVRTAAQPPSEQLLVTVIDDATLDTDPRNRPTTAYHDEIGSVLEQALAAGATGVAIDIFMPGTWIDSEPFFRLLTGHSDRLALAVHSGQDEQLVGTEVAEGPVTMILGADRAAAMFGYSNLALDRDGVLRRFTHGFTDVQGAWHPTLASRATTIITGRALVADDPDRWFWVDYRIDGRQLPVMSWKDLRTTTEQHPEQLAGRFLLVGADIEGFGDQHHPVPCTGMDDQDTCRVPGVMLQALMIETLLHGCPVRRAGAWSQLLLLGLYLASLVAVLWMLRFVPALLIPVCGTLVYIAASYVVFSQAEQLMLVVGPLVLLALLTMLGVAVRLVLPQRPQPRDPERTSR